MIIQVLMSGGAGGGAGGAGGAAGAAAAGGAAGAARCAAQHCTPNGTGIYDFLIANSVPFVLLVVALSLVAMQSWSRRREDGVAQQRERTRPGGD